ncbi:hypothetical protein H6F67_01015 [Microcoleus sp. FACHB-1515]|nr:hypothetical protein [Microcoleus sp. FACHB-1515]
MMIRGIEGMTPEAIDAELQRGAKFVLFQYCISVLILTFKRPSDIYFVKSNESAIVKGLRFSLISFFLGWWGIPWGPIYTIGTFIVNFKGGRDITAEVIGSFNQPSDD